MHPFGYISNMGLVCNIIKNLSIYYSNTWWDNMHKKQKRSYDSSHSSSTNITTTNTTKFLQALHIRHTFSFTVNNYKNFH
jgi:hypothetical protein